ncbi:MAG TPA: hypothetical protein VFX89_11945 [Gammaproteobacteria bacterium]|nr:hypothetical protein [Gammaproteobacteria bacterium]
MQAESLEILEKADVPPAQARAIVRAIDVEIGAHDTLATKQDLAVLHGEMANLRVDFAKLEGRVAESASSITRQMYMAILGQMAVLLGFAYFFATHVR